LIETLFQLRDLGNTLIVVEHDEQTLRVADWIVDLGPGAGIHGGHVVAQGTPQQICNHPESLTGKYLSGRLRVPHRNEKRKGTGQFLVLRGAREHNLKNIDVQFPLGKFVVITGVSGSGKSSLLTDLLYPVLMNRLQRTKLPEGDYDSIEGIEEIDKVILIDQGCHLYGVVFLNSRSFFLSSGSASPWLRTRQIFI
jgi:excinuclease ABC subunit A